MIWKRRLHTTSKTHQITEQKKKASPKKSKETEPKKKQSEARDVIIKEQTVPNPYARRSAQETKESDSGQQKRSASSQHVATSVLDTGSRISSQGGAQNTLKNRQTDDKTWARFNKFTSNPTW